MLAANALTLDAVLYTHDHADHTHGIDDLRQVFHAIGRPVDCYAHPATWKVLKRRFDYVFDGRDGYPPTCLAHELPAALRFGEVGVRWFPQVHGDIGSVGYRFEWQGRAAAYSTDLNDLNEDAAPFLENLDVCFVDALRRNPHPTHTHLERTLGWIERFRPKRAVLIHMDQSMDYAALARELPAGVEPGYDMLTIRLRSSP